jgi:2-desacetyl-2-hydroxyethyl bacteriochlorophyllide A dehydrogenase
MRDGPDNRRIESCGVRHQEFEPLKIDATSSNTTARSAVLTGPRAIEVRDVEVAEPENGEVRIAALFSGISAGTEMNVYRGRAPQWQLRLDESTRLFSRAEGPQWTYPLTYGYANVGSVLDVGPGVTSPAVGDTVFSYSPHQSVVVASTDSVVRLPDGLDPRLGVLNANLNTALNGVLDARPSIGDVVVVSGLGVIGLLVTQLTRRAGAGLVVGVDRVPSRRSLATQMGADVAIDPAEGVAEKVRALTRNRGADIVIEVSGATPALNEAIRTVGFGGRVIAMSWYGGTFESLNLAGEFHHNRPRIFSSQVGSVNPDLGPLWDTARRQEVVSRLFMELDLAPLFTHEFPIERAAEAYELVDQAPDGLVQCVLTYGKP